MKIKSCGIIKKTLKNQRLYRFFQWSVIILAAIVPVFVLVGGTIERWLAAVSSFFVSVGTASNKTFKFQEKWIDYRTTCETLKKEIYLFRARINEYKDYDDPMALFVSRVEALISRENTLWLTSKDSSKR